MLVLGAWWLVASVWCLVASGWWLVACCLVTVAWWLVTVAWWLILEWPDLSKRLKQPHRPTLDLVQGGVACVQYSVPSHSTCSSDYHIISFELVCPHTRATLGDTRRYVMCKNKRTIPWLCVLLHALVVEKVSRALSLWPPCGLWLNGCYVYGHTAVLPRSSRLT